MNRNKQRLYSITSSARSRNDSKTIFTTKSRNMGADCVANLFVALRERNNRIGLNEPQSANNRSHPTARLDHFVGVALAQGCSLRRANTRALLSMSRVKRCRNASPLS